MNPTPIDGSKLLNGIASDLNGELLAAAVVILLRADGSWCGIMPAGLSHIVCTHILEASKIDLILGGDKWSYIDAAAEAANDN